jgi:hypothetical protein
LGRTKTQRETRNFSMTLVIKTYQNKTHQNNNKKHINFFGNGPRPNNFFFGGGGGGGKYYFYFFYSLKKLFEEMRETMAQYPLPPSLDPL